MSQSAELQLHWTWLLNQQMHPKLHCPRFEHWIVFHWGVILGKPVNVIFQKGGPIAS